MARGILWIALMVCALLFTGCSSHPPSAAAFMNMKGNGASVVVGATARVGDNHEEGRDDNDYIHREGYWNLDFSMLGRFFNLVMTGVTLENYTPRGILGAHGRYVGLQGWVGVATVPAYGDNVFTGGVMLIEEYPVTEKFRVGLSEYVSRNAYDMIDPINSVVERCSGFYKEFGAGAYMSFGNLSLEFRYGREIENPNNRYYLALNYQFHIIHERKDKQRRQELKNVVKELHETAQEISVRKRQMKQRIREERERGEEDLEKTEEEKRQLRELRKTLDQQKMKIRELEQNESK